MASFTYIDGETYEVEILKINNITGYLDVKITDLAWSGAREGWVLGWSDLNPRCECGNPFKLCHPEA